MQRGIIIQIPSGSDKSTYINNLNPKYKKKFLDADELLNQLGIKNKLNYWYEESENNNKIINKIRRIIYKAIEKGFNIFISANPMKLNTDIIIIPDALFRWKNHRKRESMNMWSPTEVLFNLEQCSYIKAIKKVPFVINNEIPDIKILNELSNYIIKKKKKNNLLSFT
jgi:hypothetical protein